MQEPNSNGQRVAVITGHTSGLGEAITATLLATGWRVHGISDTSRVTIHHDALTNYVCDIRWGDDILQIAHTEIAERIDVLINCAGVNHINHFPSLTGKNWEDVMDVNAKSIMMMTQAFLPFLQRTNDRAEGGTVLNIVSNAAHVPMTHSLVYNASKAAALMMTLQMARELFKSHGLTVFAISPNKLKGTRMSRYIEEAVPALRGWTPEEAEAYQRNALPIGEETDPNRLAEFVGFLLSTKDRHRYLHGCNIPYGA